MLVDIFLSGLIKVNTAYFFFFFKESVYKNATVKLTEFLFIITNFFPIMCKQYLVHRVSFSATGGHKVGKFVLKERKQKLKFLHPQQIFLISSKKRE